ncbi:ABC transporter permease [Yinghuangia aomiensis]
MDAEAEVGRRSSAGNSSVPVHVYEPYHAHSPPLRVYFREVWQRRRFAYRMAHATLKGRNYETVFGQLWLVINPLLLAAVYFMLVTVLAGSPHGNPLMGFTVILSGLFSYYYTRNIVQLSSTSITGGGKMIMNMAFPKALLPLSSLFSSFMMYWPTMVVYAIAHAAARPGGRHRVRVAGADLRGADRVQLRLRARSSPRWPCTSATRPVCCRARCGSGSTCPRSCSPSRKPRRSSPRTPGCCGSSRSTRCIRSSAPGTRSFWKTGRRTVPSWSTAPPGRSSP